jgi:hypothetical protein
VIFLLRTAVDVFLFGVSGHLLISCMALQTFWSMSIRVYTSRLAFTRCLPSILKKKVLRPSSFIFHHRSCLCIEEDLCFFLVSNLFWFFCVCCLSCDILEKRSQPQYASVKLIRMSLLRSHVLTTAELLVINSGFHRFLKLCGCNGLPHGRSCCFLNGCFQQFLSTRNPCNWNLLKLKFLTLIFEIQIGVLPHFSLVSKPYGCWKNSVHIICVRKFR